MCDKQELNELMCRQKFQHDSSATFWQVHCMLKIPVDINRKLIYSVFTIIKDKSFDVQDN